MRKLVSFGGGLLLLLLLCLQNSAAPPSLDEVLMRVSHNVRDFQDSLPDFVCNEKITSISYEKNGLVSGRRVVDSSFTGIQKNDGKGHSYIESREVEAIEGVPAAKGMAMPSLPFRYGGGFSSALVSIFTPEVLDLRTYKMAGDTFIGSTPAMVIEYATKKGQTSLLFEVKGKKVIVKDTGKAWIDPVTMQVLRLERHFLDFPTFSSFATFIDYGETKIGGKTFWMPKTVRAEATDDQAAKNKVEYIAEYSKCRRFTADVELSIPQ